MTCEVAHRLYIKHDIAPVGGMLKAEDACAEGVEAAFPGSMQRLKSPQQESPGLALRPCCPCDLCWPSPWLWQAGSGTLAFSKEPGTVMASSWTDWALHAGK